MGGIHIDVPTVHLLTAIPARQVCDLILSQRSAGCSKEDKGCARQHFSSLRRARVVGQERGRRKGEGERERERREKEVCQ
jgi:hypothetical protein